MTSNADFFFVSNGNKTSWVVLTTSATGSSSLSLTAATWRSFWATFLLSRHSEFSFSAIKCTLLGVLFSFFLVKSCLRVPPVCEGTIVWNGVHDCSKHDWFWATKRLSECGGNFSSLVIFPSLQLSAPEFQSLLLEVRWSLPDAILHKWRVFQGIQQLHGKYVSAFVITL